LVEDGDFGRKRWQVWHLFIWSILGGKPGLTQFFVAQSAAPLGKQMSLSFEDFALSLRQDA
jgi:hypothetical protein